VRKAISFCFDDGFRRSARTIADAFSARGLSACFAVLSQPEGALDPFVQGADIGDWDFWRQLTAEGHELASHGLIHERYDEIDLPATQSSVIAALDILKREIPTFDSNRSVFHVPYLSAPAQTVEWLATRSLGVRLDTGKSGLTPWEDVRPGCVIDCLCYGPENVGQSMLSRIREFRAQEGWLVLVMHGVDGEGWGPVSRVELEQILDAAIATGARIAPPNEVMSHKARP
jgi:peptidoglycan/xylan/chitin deacetylase (PgdA/CDA1 family)